ncbi:hypothetical protein H1C71_031110, partial [Ictidomys tridecemlineatus]
IRSLIRQTRGSTGLDICASAKSVLTPEMGVQIIPTGVKGPLPKGTVGLLLGCSSSTLKELMISTGVIDPNNEGEIKIIASSPKGISVISPGDRIAQLLIIPSLHDKFSSHAVERGSKRLGSTVVDWAMLSLNLDYRPMLKLN